ncbi:MAG TPA: DeoR family transcriptional regulator [Candidatus Paceibacterota bacterium]|nr:DeoR family transcriptional regulator [Candidatus Paceibacterota bacterium]
MKETGKERFILTKTYEVAYALFRLAAQMHEKDFAEPLRASGIALLGATAAEDYAAAERSLRVMECLVKFGGDVGMIGNLNTDVLMREIYALDAAIAERRTAVKTDEVNIAEMFSSPESIEHPPAETHTQELAPYREPAIRQPANDSAIRQNIMLERIRQSGNCRLKDIQEILPDCSERTIRYDLQTLLEKNLIERIGNAGPSVFYRASAAGPNMATRGLGAVAQAPEAG